MKRFKNKVAIVTGRVAASDWQPHCASPGMVRSQRMPEQRTSTMPQDSKDRYGDDDGIEGHAQPKGNRICD